MQRILGMLLHAFGLRRSDLTRHSDFVIRAFLHGLPGSAKWALILIFEKSRGGRFVKYSEVCTLHNSGDTMSELTDDVPSAGIVGDVGDANILKDQIDRMLQIIDSGLDALFPGVGTAREFADDQRQVCKMGLNVAKAATEGLKSLIQLRDC